VLGVTDHDTVGGLAEAAAACAAHGLELVSGIEITAVLEAADVHVLGYFIDSESASLQQFLAEQRRRRIDRVREMVARLASFGIELDADAIVRPALEDASRSAGRPWIARALVAAGRVTTTDEAFALWLARGRPAYVPRQGPAPVDVFNHIHAAGGLASLAHPVLNQRDDCIEKFAAHGLDALEAYHSDHNEFATRRYLSIARRLNLLVTGGSDYHADDTHGSLQPGSVSLPREAFERLVARVERARR
jgi:predicted metal-dependent phosphoesterase TrpH